MWPYWLLFLIPTYFAMTRLKAKSPILLNDHPDKWPLALRLIFVFLVLVIGLRHEVGGDWITYVDHIENAVNDPFNKMLGHGDPAYSFLNWIGANIGGGMYFVNIICAIFFSWGLLSFCLAQTRPWLAIAVSIPYLVIVVGMGYTRQGVAIGLAMLAIGALLKRNILRFLLWIALAAAFHKSALILIPLAILANSKQKILTFIWVGISGFLLFVLLLQEALDSLLSNYVQDEMQSSGAAIRVAMNAIPAVLFLTYRKKFILTSLHYSFWTWMSWGALLFIVALNLSPSSTAVDRVALYWIPLQLFVLSRLPNAIGKINGKNTALVYLVITYSALVQLVWLYFAKTSYAWLPYQFYPYVWFWQ